MVTEEVVEVNAAACTTSKKHDPVGSWFAVQVWLRSTLRVADQKWSAEHFALSIHCGLVTNFAADGYAVTAKSSTQESRF